MKDLGELVRAYWAAQDSKSGINEARKALGNALSRSDATFEDRLSVYNGTVTEARDSKLADLLEPLLLNDASEDKAGVKSERLYSPGEHSSFRDEVRETIISHGVSFAWHVLYKIHYDALEYNDRRFVPKIQKVLLDKATAHDPSDPREILTLFNLLTLYRNAGTDPKFRRNIEALAEKSLDSGSITYFNSKVKEINAAYLI